MASYFEQRISEIRSNGNLVSARLKQPAVRTYQLDRFPPVETMRRGHIYFAMDGYHVKIGFTTNIPGRMAALNTASHRHIHVQQAFCSYDEAEKMVHRRFQKHHVKGEWFKFDMEMEDFWDDIFDYQGCHAGGETGTDFVKSLDDVFFQLPDLAIMLENVGTPWQQIARAA